MGTNRKTRRQCHSYTKPGARAGAGSVNAAGVDDRMYLCQSNLRQAVRAWLGCVGKVRDPVIFILDLNDPIAMDVAVGTGLAADEAVRIRDSLRGVAIPVVIASVERTTAASFAALASPHTQISQRLLAGGAPGCIDIVTVANAGNLLVRQQFPHDGAAT